MNVAARGTTQLVMTIVVLNTAVRGAINFAMVVVIDQRGRSWDDSDRYDHCDVTNSRSWDDSLRDGCRDRACDGSACDGHHDVITQPPVGRFNS